MWIIIITLFLYAAVEVQQCLQLKQQQTPCRRWCAIGLSLMAVLAHSWLLHNWIDLVGGQNLDIFNMVSLVVWIVALLLWLLTLRQPLGPLWVLVAPVAFLSILLGWVFPGMYITDTRADPEVLTHILLTVLLVGVICVAGLQALVLRWQQSMLKQKKECVWFSRLPALETMERLLFQLLWVGFALLSVVLLTSLVSYGHLIIDNTSIMHKAAWVGLAWFVFLITLVGHHVFAWRGRRAALGTLACMLVIVVVYLSSRVLA